MPGGALDCDGGAQNFLYLARRLAGQPTSRGNVGVRSKLGVVLQDTFLFDGTIRENVAFSRPDASADEILAACRVARVDDPARPRYVRRRRLATACRGVLGRAGHP